MGLYSFHAGAINPANYNFEVWKTWYLHRDQLGSVLAVSDESGRVRGRYWYDPWGKRTSATVDPTNVPVGERLEDSWRRGFVSQEHLPDSGLIHLNGRVYDPGLGRFTSVDPINQAPGDTQLWSGYGYARDNPLKFVDPSGYGFFGDVWNAITAPVRAVASAVSAVAQGIGHVFEEAGKWIAQNWRQIVIVAAVIVVTVVTGGAGAGVGAAILSGMAAGATGGALGAALYGGSLEDILPGAIKGAVIGGISAGALYGLGSAAQAGEINDVEAIAGHGLVGGLSESAGGGNFFQGFAAGAFTKGVDMYAPETGDAVLNTTRAAVVGGTVASLDGGNFANGAVTGAFSYAFNDALHPSQPAATAASRAPAAEPDPYSLEGTTSVGVQLNIGGSTGMGPKVFDVLGTPQVGFSGSCCGVGPGGGFDYVGGVLSPNIGLSAPGQLGSIGVGGSLSNLQLSGSASVRVLSFEVSGSATVNMPRLYQRVEQSIYRWMGVGQYAPQ